ncbi:MAG: hypothetical protein WCJ55_15370 [Chloroflexales bacterium]
MAWIANPTVQIIMFFRDDDGAMSQHMVNLPTDDIGFAVGFAKLYGTLVRAVSSCALTKMHINLKVTDDATPHGAVGSSIYQRSVFIFQTVSTPPFRYIFAVPGVIATKLLQPPDPYAGVQFDASDLDIAALVSAMVDGIGGDPTQPVAPWNPAGTWGSGGGSGGTWGGGGSGCYDDWGWGSGGGSGGPWGSDPGGPGSDFTWDGDFLGSLLIAYRGYDGTGRKW